MEIKGDYSYALSDEQAQLLLARKTDDYQIATLTTDVNPDSKTGYDRKARINVAYGIAGFKQTPPIAWVNVSNYTNEDSFLIPCKFSGINGIDYRQNESADKFDVISVLSFIMPFVKLITKLIGKVFEAFQEFAKELLASSDKDDKVTQANVTEDIAKDKKKELNEKDSSVVVQLPPDVLPKGAAKDYTRDGYPGGVAGIAIFTYDGNQVRQLLDPDGELAKLMMKDAPQNAAWRIPKGITHIGFTWLPREGGKNIGDCWGVLYLYGK